MGGLLLLLLGKLFSECLCTKMSVSSPSSELQELFGNRFIVYFVQPACVGKRATNVHSSDTFKYGFATTMFPLFGERGTKLGLLSRGITGMEICVYERLSIKLITLRRFLYPNKRKKILRRSRNGRYQVHQSYFFVFKG